MNIVNILQKYILPALLSALRTVGRSRTLKSLFSWKVLMLVVIALLLHPNLRYYVTNIIEYPFHYKEYKHFGIRIPNGYKIHGIDVSRYQSRIDWTRVNNMKVGDVQIDFAFIKATQGTWIKDPHFERNWEKSKENGVVRGAYHFFHPSLSPKSQALHFAKTVKLEKGDLPPVCDVEKDEGLGKEMVCKSTLAFLRLLEVKYGVKPILYTYHHFYKKYFADNPDFEKYTLWIAHYHVNDLSLPDDRKWHFWQHSDEGNVNGINEKVDFNIFYGDSAALRQLCIK